jgi:predicted transcriptional regulator
VRNQNFLAVFAFFDTQPLDSNKSFDNMRYGLLRGRFVDPIGPERSQTNFEHNGKIKMSDTTLTSIDSATLLDLTARIVSAYAGNASLTPAELTDMIGSVSRALAQLSSVKVEAESKELTPAVPIKKSVTPDYIVCLEDGKKLKMLKRHLMSTYNMTPADYRAKWNLPRDYPMVAPNYAATRSQLAKKIGLGRSPAAPVAPAKPAGRRGRPRKVA